MGFYYRYAFDFRSKKLLLVPIQRYICQRKKSPPENSHRTFSLLPNVLIPYNKYDITTVVFLNDTIGQMPSFVKAWLYCVSFLNIDIGYDTGKRMLLMFEAACVKIASMLKVNSGRAQKYLISNKSIRISYRYYQYINRFLFGVPSQERF